MRKKKFVSCRFASSAFWPKILKKIKVYESENVRECFATIQILNLLWDFLMELHVN